MVTMECLPQKLGCHLIQWPHPQLENLAMNVLNDRVQSMILI